MSRYKVDYPGMVPSPYCFDCGDRVMAMAFELNDGTWEIRWPDGLIEPRLIRPPEIPVEDERQIAPGVWLHGVPLEDVEEVALLPGRHPRMRCEGWPVLVSAPVPDELDLDDW